jgi:hydroxymethylbilane synthase
LRWHAGSLVFNGIVRGYIDGVIRLGTRKSMLAMAQSQWMISALGAAHGGLKIEVVPIVTSGDRTKGPLAEDGGKGLFVKELELALLEGRIDLAVHSYKDVPVTMPIVDGQGNLVIAAVPGREDARDALVVGDGIASVRRIGDLPKGARIGTGSVRRRCQLLAIREDLRIEPVRGNVDTRLKKLAAGEFDALILAVAGLRRIGLWDDARMTPIQSSEMLPAAGQGALALQCRGDDARTQELVRAIGDAEAARCVDAERWVVRLLGGDCQSPIGVLATMERSDFMKVELAVGESGGNLPVHRVAGSGPLSRLEEFTGALCRQITQRH